MATRHRRTDCTSDSQIGLPRAMDWPRRTCCGRSSCYFCHVCCKPLPPDDSAATVMPRVKLPVRVGIMLREERRKSTGLHAKVLAPEHVDIYSPDDAIPEFNPATTVVAFPSAQSTTWAEMENLDKVETLLLLCCPWQQYHRLLELPQLSGLRHVRIAKVPQASEFWRVPTKDEGHLSTIEALARLVEEYEEATTASSACSSSAAAEQPPGPAQQQQRSPLLFLFDLIREKIKSVGVANATLPWEGAAREKRRRELEQPLRVRQRSVGRTARAFHEYDAT